MSDVHSEYSASGFEAAMLCPGKRTMERGLPDSSSKYADEGTAAHALLSDCLDGKTTTAGSIEVRAHYQVNGKLWPVTDDMATAVQTALDQIHAIVGDGMLLSETLVNYSAALGVPSSDAWGTADVIAAVDHELQVHDYKHGRGVEVFAEENPQMMLYALGALAQAQGVLGDFTQVRMVIHQPRIKSEPSQWVCTVEQLEAWVACDGRVAVIERLRAASEFDRTAAGTLKQAAWDDSYLRPNEKSCKFCRAQATCPALAQAAVNEMSNRLTPATIDDFDVVQAPTIAKAPNDKLAAAMAKADLIEDWIKAVRAEVERRLLAGGEVPGFKIVQGRQGNRAWADATAAESALKSMRLKVEEMFDLKLISPTTAEKLVKAKVIGPRQWKTLEAIVVRTEGAKHVAPITDPRPALAVTPASDDFDTVTADSDFA